MVDKKQQLNHLAIIPDGNSRWAVANNLPITTGYKKGFDRIVELSKASRDLGIHTLTVWGLSTENWKNRPKGELDFIISLLINGIDELFEDAMREGVRVFHMGRRDRLPEVLIKKLDAVIEKSRNNTNYILNLALDYGGVDEIIRCVQKISRDVAAGAISVEDISKVIGNPDSKIKEYLLNSYLDNAQQPFPYIDYVIRTSGEIRLSGLMPIQAAYAEFYFEPCLFPDFDAEKLKQAIDSYYNRNRRFGGGH
jgi:undecaprenyl diphosphate synthase